MSGDHDQTLTKLPGQDPPDNGERTLSHPGVAPVSNENQTLSHPGQGNPAEGGQTLSHPGKRESSAAIESAAGMAIWKSGECVDGKYDVTGVIGRGGMGIVYKVHHREWNIDMAVKTPLPNLVSNTSARARFFREAQTWVDLGLHPNIVQCWYVRELDGLPRVFADFVAGGSLKNWMQDGKVKPGEWGKIIDLVVQACDGLGYAHERGVVHRDVKPANMLMTADGRLCVTDFGLVKVAGVEEIESSDEGVSASRATASLQDTDATMLTMTGSVMGTPEYGAPEQWGEARHVDARADIYALGITLYEMCCGRRPFDDGMHRDTPQVLIGRHLSTRPPDPRTFRPDLPENLTRIALQCLEKKPEARPHSLRALRELLAAAYQAIEGKQYEREIPEATEARPDGWNNRAVSLWDLDQPGAAMAAWQEALKLDPRHPEALYNSSLLQWRAGKITDFDAEERLRGCDASLRRSRFYLGLLNLERQAAGEAETDFNEGLQDATIRNDGTAWRALGHVQMAQEKFEQAEQSYAHALERMPKDALSFGCQAKAKRKTRMAPVNGAEVLVFPARRCMRSIDLHAGSMRAIAVTPDGNHIFGARGDFTLCLWELPWGSYIRGYPHGREINAVGVIQDGRFILTGCADTVLRMWDKNNERPIDTFYGKGHVGAIRSLAVAPSGAYAVTGGSDKSVRLWGIPKGNLVATFWEHTDSVEALAITPDGLFALSASDDQTVRVWDLNAGACAAVLDQAVRKKWKSLALTPDSSAVIVGGADGTLCLWELRHFKMVRTFSGHRGSVLSLAVSPDGRHLLSGGEDQTVRLWEIASGRCIRTFSGHSAPVQTVSFSPDGGFGFSGALQNANHPLRIWDLALEVPAAARPVLNPERRGVAIDAKLFTAPLVVCKVESQAESQAAQRRFKQLLKTAHELHEARDHFLAYRSLIQAREVPGYERDPQALALNLELSRILPRTTIVAGYQKATLDGHAHGTKSVVVTPNGKFIVSIGYQEKVLRVWKLSGGPGVSLEGHTRPVDCLAATPDSKFILSGGSDDMLRLWELNEPGHCIRTFEGHNSSVLAIAVSPDGRIAVSGSYDSNAAMWELSSGRRIRVFEGHAGPVKAVAITPDGRSIVSGGRDGILRLWSMATGACLKTFSGHIGEINSVAVTANGRSAVSAGEDKTLRVWNLATGQCEGVLKGTHGDVMTLGLTPDARYAFSGGVEGPETPVRVWEIITGRCVHTIGVHPKGLQTLSLSGDACFAVSAGADGPIRIWEIEWELDAGRKVLPQEKGRDTKALARNPFSFEKPPMSPAGTHVINLPSAPSPPAPPPTPPPAAPNTARRRTLRFEDDSGPTPPKR